MYKVYEKLLKKKKVTSYKVSQETGISQTTLSDWKTGRCTPKIDKLLKIAEYFGVDVSVFIKTK